MSFKSGNRIRTSLSDGKLSSKSSTSLQDIDEKKQEKESPENLPLNELNRLSIGNDSVSTVKTSDTIKKDDSRRKSGSSETRTSFGNLPSFSLKRDVFSRSDNKSPTRPNLATINEGIRNDKFFSYLIILFSCCCCCCCCYRPSSLTIFCLHPPSSTKL